MSLEAEVFSLPSLQELSRRTDWRLDARGLEWTDIDGRDHWMPFACIRLATLGNIDPLGWQLRLSGPPGAVMFGSGPAASQADMNTFSRLARGMIEGAAGVGCRVQFRLNHSKIKPAWLWARAGQKVESGAALASILKRPPYPHVKIP